VLRPRDVEMVDVLSEAADKYASSHFKFPACEGYRYGGGGARSVFFFDTSPKCVRPRRRCVRRRHRRRRARRPLSLRRVARARSPNTT
jgi:hypothetical protein